MKKVLLQERDRRRERMKELGRQYKKSDYVFTWEDGTLNRPDYTTRSFQRVLKKHNLPKMRFHDLRHSTASILYDKGWDLKDIQSWLRHSSIDVTSDITRTSPRIVKPKWQKILTRLSESAERFLQKSAK